MTVRNLEDTIAAIATPRGEGAIGIVRLSGPDAVGVVSSCFVSSRGRDISAGRQRVYHGEIRDGAETLDEVLVHVMRAPHTYTREDVVEINCHGGPGPLNAVLELVLRRGARLAQPGEFTKRAFLNGRIDLVQAEAVLDRIRAQTRAGLQAAGAAARGRLSAKIVEIRGSLLDAKSRIEAAVDFPDQDVPELITLELRAGLESAAGRMRELLGTADAGRLYREGARVAIAGRPNVGKSSLFNALLRESRAIVTSRPGTTRDLLEEVVAIQGIPVRLTDMAGLRETEDEVERLGVAAARTAVRQAGVVLFVTDVTEGVTEEDRRLFRELAEEDLPLIHVWNKCDVAPAQGHGANGLSSRACTVVRVSAKTGEGLEQLESTLASVLLDGRVVAPDEGLITRLHQKDSLRRALESVERLLANFGASPEFLALDLDEALRALGEITGETTPDDVLERIFSAFCIGK